MIKLQPKQKLRLAGFGECGSEKCPTPLIRNVASNAKKIHNMKGLIDFRNENLWKSLNKNYNIKIEDSPNEEYSCYSENNDITFYIVNKNLCKDSFTHEMLHAYLRMNDCFIGAGLKNTIWQSKILTAIMSNNLLEHIGNCLDHVKMLPKYLDMGFERKKFILDYDTRKCSSEELTLLKQNYRQGKKVNPNAVDLYIGKLIGILVDPNDSFDYTKELKNLEKLDPLLYAINTRMINFWSEIKIENRQVIDDDYHSVLFEYYDNLKKWISKNKISV
jgi:hypothetical protein